MHETFCNLHRICRSELAPAYVRLLRDTEAEVRVAAAGKVAAFSKLLMPPMIVSQILPCVSELAMDSSQFVRAALAGVVMELAPVLGKQATIDHLVPVFLTLLKDAYPDVRLNVISKLDQVNQVRCRCHVTAFIAVRCSHEHLAFNGLFRCFRGHHPHLPFVADQCWFLAATPRVPEQVIGIELLAQSLLPAIKELAEDKHWRVRLAIVEHIPLLASQLGPDFFQDKLGPQCMKSLEDQVRGQHRAQS